MPFIHHRESSSLEKKKAWQYDGSVMLIVN